MWGRVKRRRRKVGKDYVGIKMEGRENTKINIESEEIPQGYGTRTE